MFNLKIKTDYIDPSYNLTFTDINHISDTGLVELFKITPKELSLPFFKGRWDEKDNQVDIDINNVSKSIYNSFKTGRGGYAGHHSTRLSESPRKFLAEINIPGKLIFRGEITFNINFGHAPLSSSSQFQ